MTESVSRDLANEIEREIKELVVEGLSAEAIGKRIKNKYGKSVKELTGKNLKSILGFGKRGFWAISGAKLVLKLKQNGLLNDWISLDKLIRTTNWIEILTFVDVVWRYHHKKRQSGIQKIYSFIREVVGGEVYVRIRSPRESRESILAKRVWLLTTTANRKLRKKRRNKWKDIEFKFEFKS